MPHGDYIEDLNMVCSERGCGKSYVFTGGEQKFLQRLANEYAAKRDAGELTDEEKARPFTFKAPKRCPECRLKKRQYFNARDSYKS